MDDEPPSISDTAYVLASMAESDADLAAGRVVPLEPVLERMRETLRRMEQRHRERAEAADPS